MEDHRKVVADFEKQIERLKADSSDATKQLRAEYEERERTTKSAHEAELAALRASLGQASSDEIERLKAKHAEEIKQLGQSHEKMIAQMNANFDKQIAQKEQDHADVVQ